MKNTAAKEEKNATADHRKLSVLHRWNVWLSAIHALQAAAIFVLAGTRVFPVTTQYLTRDAVASSVAGHPVLTLATQHLSDINLAYLIIVFFLVSAVAHGLVARVFRRRYEADLKKGVNRVRWVEYSLSAGIMMVAIGLLSGAADASTLLLIFGLTALMNFHGLGMELLNQKRKPISWLPFWLGVTAGLLPWVVCGIYVFGAGVYGGSVPAFVYWIYLSLFVCFAGFALNMYLQYKKKGKWADYLYGERVYMMLSLIAKTALAWQIFAGTLRP